MTLPPDEAFPMRGRMLIDTARLATRLDDPDLLLFDCRHDLAKPDRGAQLYAEGHLPGAFFAPVDTALSGPKTGANGRHPLPSPDQFAHFLESHGASASTHLVAYDDAGGMYAARLWWLARWIGGPEVLVLDGGLPKWIAEGRPLTSVVPAARPTGSVRPTPRASHLADAEEILKATSDARLVVLDARAAERFRGDVEPIDKVAGHIPGALNRFYKTNLRPDGTLRPAEELREEFADILGSRPHHAVVHQCGSGITACANLFAMEYAGLGGSRLYAGSWSEWISDPSRPVARG